MAYFMMGPCIGCGTVFLFNPNRVPSSKAVTGQREPICERCVEQLNPMRIKHGLKPIIPLPGAYEPVEEEDDIE